MKDEWYLDQRYQRAVIILIAVVYIPFLFYAAWNVHLLQVDPCKICERAEGVQCYGKYGSAVGGVTGYQREEFLDLNITIQEEEG